MEEQGGFQLLDVKHLAGDSGKPQLFRLFSEKLLVLTGADSGRFCEPYRGSGAPGASSQPDAGKAKLPGIGPLPILDRNGSLRSGQIGLTGEVGDQKVGCR